MKRELIGEFLMDLHIHTCLSPCADITMIPSVIADALATHEIGIAAVTDHNGGGNALAVSRVVESRGITPIPGMEVCTREDVHVLTLFPDTKVLSAFEKDVVRPALKDVRLNPEVHGYQLLVNERDEFIGMEDVWLGQSLELPLEAVVSKAREYGAIVILSHVFRMFGVIYQLGFVPSDLPIHGVEVMSPEEEEEVRKMGQLQVVANSDAHHPDHIGRRKSLLVAHDRSFEELRLAFSENDERSVKPLWD